MRPTNRVSVARIGFMLALLLMLAPLTRAQDALNLPTELYVLYNAGQVQRFGTGAEGVSFITAESQFVIDFGISPDGNWLAYRTPDALVVRDVFSEDGIALDTAPSFPPLRGADPTIAWSPDGQRIAYTTENGLRVLARTTQPPAIFNVADSAEGRGFGRILWSPDGTYIAAQTLGGIWQIYTTRGGLSLVAAVPFTNGAVWETDTAFVFAPTDGGLVRLDLAQANTQTPILQTPVIYTLLTLRPDGEIGAFAQAADGTGTFTQINPLTGARETVGEAGIALDGLRWTPGGELALAFRGGALVLVNPLDGSGFSLPVTNAVAYGWGPLPLNRVDGLAIPGNLFFTAPDEAGVLQVWQLFTDATPAVPLTRANEDVRGYQVAPDGNSVVYSSAGQVWLQTLNNGADPRPLADLSADIDAQAVISGDNRTVAYSDSGIWTVPVDGSAPPTLALEFVPGGNNRAYFAPRFAPNFGAVLVDVIYSDGLSTGVLDVASGELRELPFGYANGTWLPDGRVLTFGGAQPFTEAGVQVSSLPTLDAPEVLVPNGIAVGDAVLVSRRRGVDVRLILDTLNDIGPQPLQVFDFREAAGLVPVLEAPPVQAPQLSAEGTFVAGLTRTRPDDNGVGRGQLVLVDVVSGQRWGLRTPLDVGQVRWQR